MNYKVASDMLNDLASGTLDFAVADPVFSLAQVRAGRLKVLGVTTGNRLNASRELPTFTEQGVKMSVTGWWAAMVPGGTPRPIVDQINKWFIQVVSSDETKAFLAQSGGDPLVYTPEQAQERLIKDVADWAEWVKLAKIQPQ